MVGAEVFKVNLKSREYTMGIYLRSQPFELLVPVLELAVIFP